MANGVFPRRFLTGVLGAAGLALCAQTAAAQQFKCPTTGGSLTFGQEANINTLDQMTSLTISTRNIAMNMYETLMTRDENNNPILELAASMTEAPDRLSYTFKLRQGIRFHNGKEMTSADVAASFERFSKVGTQRSTLANVDRWETPDPLTFILRMKQPQPTFIESLSSFSQPIVVFPAELKDTPSMQMTRPVGTGPFEIVEVSPGSHVRIKRYDGYQPNTAYQQRTGFGGYKQACLDTVTFRIVTEAGARVAGLKTGELHAVEDIPAKSVPDLRKDSNITILPLNNWWIQIANPNTSFAPTDNLLVRRAIQAALDMEEILDAASDGNYRLNVGFQYPNQPSYTDAGKETYNLKDAALAKRLLQQSGYKGEPVILLTNKDYSPMYNSALVMQQQLQAIGVNAQMKVVDWPTSVQMMQNTTEGWNFFFTGWGTQPALGALATMQFLVEPGAMYKPKDKVDDPEVLAAWKDMNDKADPAERQAAFARMQKLVLEKVYALPFGSFTKIQATRANVKNFTPFRIPRMANVYIQN
jgi:peptide/nickel transport system substrate-binding protein